MSESHDMYEMINSYISYIRYWPVRNPSVLNTCNAKMYYHSGASEKSWGK